MAQRKRDCHHEHYGFSAEAEQLGTMRSGTDANDSIVAQTNYEDDGIDRSPLPDKTDDEKIDVVATQIMQRFKSAFEELAK